MGCLPGSISSQRDIPIHSHRWEVVTDGDRGPSQLGHCPIKHQYLKKQSPQHLPKDYTPDTVTFSPVFKDAHAFLFLFFSFYLFIYLSIYLFIYLEHGRIERAWIWHWVGFAQFPSALPLNNGRGGDPGRTGDSVLESFLPPQPQASTGMCGRKLGGQPELKE